MAIDPCRGGDRRASELAETDALHLLASALVVVAEIGIRAEVRGRIVESRPARHEEPLDVPVADELGLGVEPDG